uniref:ATP-dependent RNA helicase SUV3L, mitochondrial n=1 Tax=Rhizophora mucronata TaxID=61149 RepID=A0A2P2Q6X4_RHIMU
MARGQIATLFRIYASKNNVSRARILLSNQKFCSLRQFENWVSGGYQFSPSFDVPCRHFSSNFIDLLASPFRSKNPKVGTVNSVDGRPSSSSVHHVDDEVHGGSGLERAQENSNSSVDFVESTDFEGVQENAIEDGYASVDESGSCNSVEDEGHRVDDMSKKKNVGKKNVAFYDPVELYQELRNAEKKGKLNRSDWETLKQILSYFANSGWAANQALAIYIGMSFFPTATKQFWKFLFDKCSSELALYLGSLGPCDEAVKFLFPVFVEYCIEEFPDEIKRFQSMAESADLTKPHTWFPFARAMKRKIIYHCGPTNSGKTYNALQCFMEARKGIYCSPLRLLAMEVFDKVNALGVYCSLHTGQEKKHVPFSSHVACTMEMVSNEELYDVAVIDEIQMLADPCRGYAWTRALLGLKADEIHLCGDPSVLGIVRKICSETGDELHEQHYERFKPLVIEAKTLLGDLRNVRSGDCIVAFSRREIFEVKMMIEKYTKHRCCVIYGALPPETRRQQATLFNDPDNEFDVLVASDAVGMGLNLNIRRIVFNSLSKYNGDRNVPILPSQVKQIAGRAGRRGSRFPEGLTTTLHLDDLPYLIECLKQPFDEVKKVGLFPFFDQVELFAGKIPNCTFPQLLEKFGENCRLDGSYFLCRHDHIKKIANKLEKVQGLSLEDRFNFCFAPINIRDPKAMYHLLRFASVYSQKLPVNIAMGMPKGSAKNDAELLDLETKHQILSAYLWLSNQFEGSFPYVEKAEAMATDIAELLGQSIIKACWKPESRKTVKPGSQRKEDGHNSPKQQRESDYSRPKSLVKLYAKKRQEKHPQEVAA